MYAIRSYYVLLGQLDVEHVDPGELLEQAAFALHHRLGRQRADVAEPQRRRAVGHDPNQIGARGVLRSEARILFDRETWIGHARRIRERQVTLIEQRLGRRDRVITSYSIHYTKLYDPTIFLEYTVLINTVLPLMCLDLRIGLKQPE